MQYEQMKLSILEETKRDFVNNQNSDLKSLAHFE